MLTGVPLFYTIVSVMSDCFAHTLLYKWDVKLSLQPDFIHYVIRKEMSVQSLAHDICF